MIQICLNKKCSYTDANEIFSVRTVIHHLKKRIYLQFSL